MAALFQCLTGIDVATWKVPSASGFSRSFQHEQLFPFFADIYGQPVFLFRHFLGPAPVSCLEYAIFQDMIQACRSPKAPVSVLASVVILFLLVSAAFIPRPATASPYSESVQSDGPLTYWQEVRELKTGGQEIPDVSGNEYNITAGIGEDLSTGETSPTGDPSLAFAGNTSDNGVITPLDKEDLTNYSKGWSWDYWVKLDQLEGGWNLDYSGTQAQIPLMLGNDNHLSPTYNSWAQNWRNHDAGSGEEPPNGIYQDWHAHGADDHTNLSITPDTGWHYFALSVEPGHARFYLDGELVEDYTGIQPSIDNAAYFTLSTYKGDTWPNGNWGSLRGNMSDIAIYNHVLTEKQIKEHYELGGGETTGGSALEYPTTFWMRNWSNAYETQEGGILSGEPITAPAGEWTYSEADNSAWPTNLNVSAKTGQIVGSPENADPGITEEYTVEVEADKPGHAPVLSGPIQLVVRPSTTQQQLRPILRFDSGEKWRPLNVDQFLTEDYGTWTPSEPANQHCEVMSPTEEEMYEGNEEAFEEKCTDFAVESEGTAENETLLPDIEWFSSHDSNAYELNVHGSENDPDDHYQPGCAGEALLDCSGSEQALYWHKIYKGESPEEVKVDEEREEPVRATGNAYYDYWDYYRYNQYEAPDPIPGDAGDHESDWEGVVVASDAPGSSPTGFDWVGMSAHSNTWRYLNGTLYCGTADGGETPCKDSADGSGQRVEDFVAKGSHGNYPRPCEEHCDRSTNEGAYYIPGVTTEQNYGGQIPWSINDNSSTLQDLNSWENKPWAEWAGNWTRSTGETVRSPLKQKRAEEPWNLYYEECSERYNEPFETGEYCESEEENEEENTPVLMKASSEQNPCHTWEGPFVQASICDPTTIQEKVYKGELGKHGDVNIREAHTGSAALTDSAPGITQMVGERPIREGSTVSIEGSLVPADQIHLVTETNSGEVYSVTLSGKEVGRNAESLNIQKQGRLFTAIIVRHHKKRKHKIKHRLMHKLGKHHRRRHLSHKDIFRQHNPNQTTVDNEEKHNRN